MSEKTKPELTPQQEKEKGLLYEERFFREPAEVGDKTAENQ